MSAKSTDEGVNEKKKPSEGFLKFQKAIKGHPDDVSSLLNCHLLVEYYLEQIIHSQLKRADIFLDDNLMTSVSNLNKVRNLCTHEMEYSISEANIDLIGRPFGKTYIETKRDRKDELLKYTLMIIIARLDGAYHSLIPKKSDG
jgi:hypothetical protein